MNRSFLVVAVLGSILLAPLACTKSPAGPNPFLPADRIAFISMPGATGEIYTVNPDGTDLKRLTNDSLSDGGVQWSPDRKKIAFQRFYPESTEIAVIIEVCISNRRFTERVVKYRYETTRHPPGIGKTQTSGC
jgi:hypothetical protein